LNENTDIFWNIPIKFMVGAKHYRTNKMGEKRTLPTIYEGKVASTAAPTEEEWRRLKKVGEEMVWVFVLLVIVFTIVSQMSDH
jgi:hypothetical protein